jgi:beta-phosphoglucomutase
MKSPGTIGAVLFDFDGVIADSETLHYQGFAAIAQQMLGLTLSRAHYDHELIGYDDVGGFAALCQQSTLPHPDVSILAMRKKEWIAERIAQVELIPGARQSIDICTHTYPWAIVSGALRSEITAILQAHQLPIPNVLISADDTPQSKPAPDPYLRGAQLMGIDPEHCVALEDTAAGCSSALAAGCRVIQLMAHTQPHPHATRHVRSHTEIPWTELALWLAA